MYQKTALALALCLLVSCRNGALKTNKVFNPNALSTQTHTIDVAKDTNLILESGLSFFIPKGSIYLPLGNLATLEFKTALTLEEMMNAGLCTRSGTDLLSSAGMFYLNIKNPDAKITRPIQVKMPTEKIEADMQLYKGQESADGNLDWVNPSPLDKEPQKNRISQGKQLFDKLCVDCHQITDYKNINTTEAPQKLELQNPTNEHFYPLDNRPPRPILIQNPSPSTDTSLRDTVSATKMYKLPLAHLYKYRDKQWLLEFTKNSSQMIAKGDEEARCLSALFGDKMPNFDQLTDAEIADIYEYIESVSERDNLPIPPYNAKTCRKKCQARAEKIQKIQEQIARISNISAQKGQKLEVATNQMNEAWANVKTQMTNLTRSETPQPLAQIVLNQIDTTIEFIPPTKLTSSYYVFNIDITGWFNVDLLLKSSPNTQSSQLSVQVNGEFRSRVEVFFILPNKKIFGQGGIDKDPTTFYFYQKSLFLPQNEPAWVYALGEEKGQFYWAVQSFQTSTNNRLSLTPGVSSAAQISKNIKRISQSIKVQVEDSGRKKFEALEQKTTKMRLEIDQLANQMQDLNGLVDSLQQVRPDACQCDCEEKKLDKLDVIQNK